MKRAIYDGVLLDRSLLPQVVELQSPLPRDSQ